MAVYTEALGDGLAVSFSMVCRLLGVARSTAYYQAKKAEQAPLIDEELCQKIKWIIERFPTFGIRRVWAWLRYRMEIKVNKIRGQPIVPVEPVNLFLDEANPIPCTYQPFVRPSNTHIVDHYPPNLFPEV